MTQLIHRMDSVSRKIFLSLALTLAFLTAIAVVWLPRFLEQSENPIKELDAAPKIPFSDEEVGKAVTRFPTRAMVASTTANPSISEAPNQSPEPSTPRELPGQSAGGGLPSREVPGVQDTEPTSDRVTTRAYLRENASVFARPNMTAEVLGTVGSRTTVRWLAAAGEGWEEILLKNGSSGYVLSGDLSFSADTSTARPTGFEAQANRGSGPNLSTLPGTVESFLATISANDIARAETYLSPVASHLDATNLGGLTPYTGAPPAGRVLRIETVAGDRDSYRRVMLVYGDKMEHQLATVWEWDVSQQRWMLVRWD